MELLLDKAHINYYNQDLVAKAGIATIYDAVRESNKEEFFKDVFDLRSILLKKNPKNIVLKNSLDYFINQLSSHNKENVLREKYHRFLLALNESNKTISSNAAKKIKPGSTVFVHSLNNQLVDMLMEASKYKKLKINVLEHRPYGFGNALSKKLKMHNIKVKVFPDLFMKDAISQADTCFFGTDGILKDGSALCKKGSQTASEITAKLNHNLYLLGSSWKYDSEDFLLSKTEEGDNLHDHVPKENITAHISEFGIFKPEFIIHELKFFNKSLR